MKVCLEFQVALCLVLAFGWCRFVFPGGGAVVNLMVLLRLVSVCVQVFVL